MQFLNGNLRNTSLSILPKIRKNTHDNTLTHTPTHTRHLYAYCGSLKFNAKMIGISVNVEIEYLSENQLF